MMGNCMDCGSPSIGKFNIDLVDYFQLCKSCQKDYDRVAAELYIEENEIQIPEFWLDDEV